jgi:hypothetical protein
MTIRKGQATPRNDQRDDDPNRVKVTDLVKRLGDLTKGLRKSHKVIIETIGFRSSLVRIPFFHKTESRSNPEKDIRSNPAGPTTGPNR